MRKKKVLVVGGGAAGLMAAGQAALQGAEVVIFEKMKQPGRKICISGKGRCNITNTADLRDFIDHFGKNGRFLHQTFHHFFAPELMRFLEDLGLPLATERGGRVFPKSGKAHDVREILTEWLESLQVRLQTNARVERLITDHGRITGLICNGKKISGDAVILATGGASYPATGSTGDGYQLTKAVNHTVIPIRPALIPLVTEGTATKKMAGLTLRNVRVRHFIDNKRKKQAFGELTFTPFGLGGPVILTLSGTIVDSLDKGQKNVIAIDLKPALDEQKLDARLLRDLEKRHQEEFGSVLRGLLPREMVEVCLQDVGINADTPAGRINSKERNRLRCWLKDLRFEITGYRPLKEAIVTAGGVALGEINPNTMESKITRGLYIVGELLDLHGDTGGYNFQAAFSTGWLAGLSAAQ